MNVLNRELKQMQRHNENIVRNDAVYMRISDVFYVTAAC
jgi:hypothetical protein